MSESKEKHDLSDGILESGPTSVKPDTNGERRAENANIGPSGSEPNSAPESFPPVYRADFRNYPPGGHLGGEDISPERLFHFLEKWAEKLTPEPQPSAPVPSSPDSGPSLVLIFLKILPIICGVGFIASLFWDFQGALYFPWSTEPIDISGLLRMITVTGLVGFGTNWLAIKMLFYPRQKRPILGQGLIPSRKDRIVLKLGEQISKEIINSELILEQIRKSGLISRHRERLTDSLRGVIDHPEFRTDIIEVSKHYINQFLRSRQFQDRVKDFVKGIDFENVGVLEGGILKVYKMLTGDEDISKRLQEVIENLTFRMEKYDNKLIEYLQSIPDALEEQSDAVENFALNAIVFLVEQVNVQNVIVDNLQRFDEARLERLLWRSTSDQLQYIQYLGCLLGLIGGLFIWLPLESIVVTGVLGLLVWGLDVLLMKTASSNKQSKSSSD